MVPILYLGKKINLIYIKVFLPLKSTSTIFICITTIFNENACTTDRNLNVNLKLAYIR